MADFVKIILYTDSDGRAKFREEVIPLNEGSPQSMLSGIEPVTGCQFRQSPIGFRSQFHCTTEPQWLFILDGEMQIGLQDGSTRNFKSGEHFYSADLLPAGAIFNPEVHGHRSCQVGDLPLVTLFVKA
jgi:hypothetical protein